MASLIRSAPSRLSSPWHRVILDGATFLRILAPDGKAIATIAEAVLLQIP